MQNEIELKLMLQPQNIPLILDWIATLSVREHHQAELGNTYFDTPDRFFDRHQMGLRVRRTNQRIELTLKTKGEIVGGLHVRPEYHLDLPDTQPDFNRLVDTHHLPIANSKQITAQLHATFSTDFTRESWLVSHDHAEIEIALDQGYICNPFGEEAICELEFELMQGQLDALFTLLDSMPKRDGMWLSSLSKAQRGYWVGQPQKQADEIEKLLTTPWQTFNETERYQFTQQLADFLRLMPEHSALRVLYKTCHGETVPDLTSRAYLEQHIQQLRTLALAAEPLDKQ